MPKIGRLTADKPRIASLPQSHLVKLEPKTHERDIYIYIYICVYIYICIYIYIYICVYIAAIASRQARTKDSRACSRHAGVTRSPDNFPHLSQYIYIYIYIYIHIYIYISLYNIYIYIYIYDCIGVYIYIYIYTYMYKESSRIPPCLETVRQPRAKAFYS